MAYICETCGQREPNIKLARRHSKQGYKTQREAFRHGKLHTLTLEGDRPPTIRLQSKLGRTRNRAARRRGLR